MIFELTLCLIEFHGRNAELFADGTGGRLGYVVVQWHDSLVAVQLVLVLSVTAFLPTRGDALVFAQETEKLLFLHAFMAMLRRVNGRPA